METNSKPCPALKSFIDYWDEWHKEWYINASSKPPKIKSIKGWDMPKSIWQYFQIGRAHV